MRKSFAITVGFVVALLTLSGCASSPVVPTPVIPTPTKSAPAVAVRSVVIYFVGDTPTGFLLFSEKQVVTGEGDLATLALSTLIDGTAKPTDLDYTNLWGNGTTLISFKKEGATGIVDLHMGKLNVGAEAEMRAIDQLLWTASTIDKSITGIQLLVDGKSIESLAGHVDATKTIALEKTYEVLSPLQISSIKDGATLTNPIAISGEACTFEANVVWTLRKDGTKIKTAPTTAETACPDRSAWNVDLGVLESGNYSFTVEDFSAKDGSVIAHDDKNFFVK